MRFCMITTFYPPYHFGGDAVFVHRLSHALAERGHDVDVYHNEDAFNSLSSSPPATGYRDHPRVRRCGLRSRLGILDLVTQQQAGCPLSHRRILRGLFSAGRYDVIHFHNPSLMGGLWLMRCAARTDAVTLYTTHEHCKSAKASHTYQRNICPHRWITIDPWASATGTRCEIFASFVPNHDRR